MKTTKNILFAFLLCFSYIAYSQTLVDEVIAIVGQNMIKYSELETNYIQSRSNSNNATQTRCDVLDNMLLNKLFLHQADIDSLEVADNDLDQEMDSRIRYMIQIYGSQERMERQMQKSLSEIRSQYRDIIKENMLIQQEQNKLTGDLKITPQEVVDFYKSIPQDSSSIVGKESCGMLL